MRLCATVDSVRLGNELGLSAAAAAMLRERTRVYHSFVPLSCKEPSVAPGGGVEVRPEWTHAWCRPNAGALRQALCDYDVPPHEALLIGVKDHDRVAAARVGIASLGGNQLMSPGALAAVVYPGAESGRAGKGKAPAAFAVYS